MTDVVYILTMALAIAGQPPQVLVERHDGIEACKTAGQSWLAMLRAAAIRSEWRAAFACSAEGEQS